jgi:hypothetical protein
VERPFHTIRQRFLSGGQESVSLNELNKAFWVWLRKNYSISCMSNILTQDDADFNMAAFGLYGKALVSKIFPGFD